MFRALRLAALHAVALVVAVAGSALAPAFAETVIVTLEADVPSEIPIGAIAHISGTYALNDVPATGQPIHWVASCQDGEGSTSWGIVTTDDRGRFDLDLDPGRCARMRLRVGNEGEYPVRAIVKTYEFTVPWHRYSLTVDGPTVVATGAAYEATFTAMRDNELAPNLPLVVTLTAPSGETTDLSGVTGPEGTLRLKVSASADSLYTLIGMTPGTADTLRDGAMLRTQARTETVDITLSMLNPDRIVNDVPTYLVGTTTRIRAAASPTGDPICLRFRLERRSAEGWWKPVTRSACRMTNERGTTTWEFDGRKGHYRVRGEFDGAGLIQPSQSSWNRLRFVRR